MGAQPMAFYHDKGLVPTAHLARRYIEGGGRLATLPDIIDARLATEPGATPWETWFTTLSAEYFGIGRSGRRIIIVAHGVGPMRNLDGILDAYRYQYSDAQRNRRGGRISQEEFHKLEDGEYGGVSIIDYEQYCQRRRYPFHEYLRASKAMCDPLAVARLGGSDRAQAYLAHHERFAREQLAVLLRSEPEDRYNLKESMGREEYAQYLQRRQNRLLSDMDDPFVIRVGDAANCSYKYEPVEAGQAMAHLLSVGMLMNVHHEGYESLAFDVSAHEWGNGCRFVGVPRGATMSTIHPGWDVRRMIALHWEELMVPADAGQVGLRPLVRLGDTWFTQIAHQGHAMQTGEPEFVVTDCQPLGGPVDFLTEIHGYHGFFRYDIKAMQAIAPPGAVGFVIDDPEIVEGEGDPTHHRAKVTFYRGSVDTSRRVRKYSDIQQDYETQMRLMSGAGGR